ncbi:hypothetical protein HMPREF9622_02794 [Cutibacterium modestum HL037PA3]|uniref:Uncharacterized protein n=1 Tax=Cutibacterium modestum HL044PA1 TaxID=765109 RepID=A0ABN0C4D9_9ACTN|nr:hypothetical protein HMPREF9621_02602 [Cutibacterium modestum HL037PA2]EFS92060.1 hypothetical protein HMPREF9607_01688 [Cutibacterium modestum HL044PA1]EFT14157.1 hypothetical protein HMPREF9622_02794 [Cutibacterium modestum HL037PA3]
MRIISKTLTRLPAAVAIGIPILEWVITGRMIQSTYWDHYF